MKKKDKFLNDSGVSHLVEYLIISSILILLTIIMVLSIIPIFIDGPLNQLNYYAYNDIGNGLSTRIVDLYVIIPDQSSSMSLSNVSILSKFNIPDDIAGKGYYVNVSNGTSRYGNLILSGDVMTTTISLSGIGETINVTGNTSSSGLNEISYDYNW